MRKLLLAKLLTYCTPALVSNETEKNPPIKKRKRRGCELDKVG